MRVETEKYLKIVRDDIVPKIPAFNDLEPDQMEDEVEKSIERSRIKWENAAALTLLIAGAGTRMAVVTGKKFDAQVTVATGQRQIPKPTNTRSTLTAWTKRNLGLYANAIRDHGNRIAQTIAGGIAGSRPVSTIVQGVANAGGILRRKIVNVARDQSEKLGGQLNTERLKAVGVKRFVWITQGDDLVRPLHESIEGETFPVGKGHPTEGMPSDPPLCRCLAGAVLPKGQLSPASQDRLAANKTRRQARAKTEIAKAESQQKATRTRAGKKAAATRKKEATASEKLEASRKELADLKKANAASAKRLGELQESNKARAKEVKATEAKARRAERQNEKLAAQAAELEEKLKKAEASTKRAERKAGLR